MENSSANDAGASGANPAELALQIHNILLPHSSEIRRRVLQSAMTLLGEAPLGSVSNLGSGTAAATSSSDEFQDLRLGPKALKWLSRNGISRSVLDEVFHVAEGGVSISADSVPGMSKREKTINCYLLAGARRLLESDIATFDDSEAIAECKRLAAYDKNNHTTYRMAIGNKMTGKRPSFTLTGPGEAAAAELIKQMGPRGA